MFGGLPYTDECSKFSFEGDFLVSSEITLNNKLEKTGTDVISYEC